MDGADKKNYGKETFECVDELNIRQNLDFMNKIFSFDWIKCITLTFICPQRLENEMKVEGGDQI